MRGLIAGSIVLALAALTMGCSPNDAKSAAPSTDAKASDGKATDGKACVMKAGGHDVLSVTAAADITCTPKDGSLTLKGHGNQLDIWLVPGAKTLDDATPKIPEQIKSEFKDFKAKNSSDLTIAGSPAKRISGTGAEADDNDPGSAELVLFKVGDNVFVACVHGEKIPADAPDWMVTVVKTAKAP